MIPVEPVVAPKKPRKGLLIGGAVAVAALVGGGVFALTRGDDSSTGGGGGGAAYSLTAAAAAAQEATNVGYEMKVSAGGFDIEINGRMDTANQLMAMNMEMPMMGSIESIVDLKNQVMYINAAAVGLGSQAPTPWISADMTRMPNGGVDALGAGSSNPLDISKAFEQADSVEEIGLETIDGEQLKHYRVTVSTSAAVAADPSLQQQLDQLGGEFPEQIVYDVWVTEDNLLRLMKFEIEAAGQTVAMEMRLTALGTIDPIVIPPADEVTDMTEQLAG